MEIHLMDPPTQPLNHLGQSCPWQQICYSKLSIFECPFFHLSKGSCWAESDESSNSRDGWTRASSKRSACSQNSESAGHFRKWRGTLAG